IGVKPRPYSSLVAFFELPEPKPTPKRKRRRQRRDEHWYRPTQMMPGYLPGFVLAASDAQAVVIGQLECFPTGFAFDLRTTSRYEVDLEEEDEPMRDPFFPRRRRAVGPEELRFGIEYSNGKKATNFDPH